jgi:AdoMet-dependent rRNA methyltransferase SPB1
MYRVCTFEHFISCNNPFPIFMEYNKIEFTEADKAKFLPLKIKLPEDYETLMEDIKLLGKREITALIKWR